MWCRPRKLFADERRRFAIRRLSFIIQIYDKVSSIADTTAILNVSNVVVRPKISQVHLSRSSLEIYFEESVVLFEGYLI